MRFFITRTVRTGITVAAIAAASGLAHGAIVAEFTAGTTTTTVDGFRGMAGDGWTTNWGFGSNGGGNFASTRTVLDTNPLDGGGNYLSIELSQEYIDGGDNRTRGTRVARQYTDYGPVALAQPHSVSFFIRLDGGLSDLNDFRAHDDNSSQLSYTTSNSASWVARWTEGWNDFRFSNVNTSTWVASNVWLYEGDVYRITIDYTPGDSAAGTYTGTVENLDYTANSRTDGSASATTGTLTLAYSQEQVNGYLNFVSYLRTATAGTPLREAEWSLDGIHVIPEPAGALLAVFGGLILGLIRRRAA